MSDRRSVLALAAGAVGLLVGLAIAISWHVFVSPQFDSDAFASSGSETSVAFVVGYLIEYFEPAPAWLPTVIVFPVLGAVLCAALAFAYARALAERRVAIGSVGLVGGAVGSVLGLCAAAWARISPPTYIGLTETQPFRVALSSQSYLWIILPLVGGIAAAVFSASATAILRHRSIEG